MNDEILEAAKVIGHRQSNRSPIEYGYVATYDPAGKATVYFPHDLANGDSVARGPYPFFTPWVGNGWGFGVGLVGGGLDGNGNPLGEPCTVIFYDPEGELGICLPGHLNANYQAMKVPAGECWLVHKDGSTLKLKASGLVQMLGTTVELGADGASQVPGNALVRQSDLQAVVDYIKGHSHPGPMGPTSAPAPPPSDATASATSFTK